MAIDPLADDEPANVRQLAEQGLTDAEIALRVGASVEAIRAMPDVRVALSDVHDARVERALYERAVGGETWSEQADKLGGTVRLYQRVLPDPTAAAKWLAIRKASEWAQIERTPAPPPLQISVQFVSARGDRLDAIDVTPGVGVGVKSDDGGGSLVSVRSPDSDL